MGKNEAGKSWVKNGFYLPVGERETRGGRGDGKEGERDTDEGEENGREMEREERNAHLLKLYKVKNVWEVMYIGVESDEGYNMCTCINDSQ